MVENYTQSSSLSRKDIKKAAKSVLNNHSIRLKLVFATLICVGAFMLSEVVKSNIHYAFSFFFSAKDAQVFDFIFSLVFSIARLLMLSPLFIGLFSFSVKLSSGKNIKFYELFTFYSDIKTLCKTWAVGATVMLPQTVLFFLFVNIPELCSVLVKKSTRSDITAWLIVAAIALESTVLVLSIFSLRLYTVINAYVCGNSQKVSLCIRAALRSTKSNILNSLLFILSFTPWILLSLCTVGVLFVIFTIPYMVVSYNIYSSKLITKNSVNHRNTEEI